MTYFSCIQDIEIFTISVAMVTIYGIRVCLLNLWKGVLTYNFIEFLLMISR